jgi:hypothetical protein
LPEYVTPAPREAGRIEGRFEFGEQWTGCEVEWFAACNAFAIESFGHKGLRCGCPSRPTGKVILEQAPVGSELEVARWAMGASMISFPITSKRSLGQAVAYPQPISQSGVPPDQAGGP